ncbi:unnamed protein product [Rhodiola kirilowii]
MSRIQALGLKPAACLIGLLLLVALAEEAVGVEFKDMGICLTECGNQVVQCTTPCALQGSDSVQCLEACGVAILGCMANCAGYKAVLMSDPRKPRPSETPNLGMKLVKSDLGN